MRYRDAAAFRQALLTRLRNLAQQTGNPIERLRKRTVFERLLARLLSVAPDRWALKGALALDFRSPERARATKDADLVGPDSVEQATEDLLAAQAVGLDDHFVFRLTRTREAVSEHPEPTVRFHVTAELAGAVFDECTIDVGLGGSGEWDMEHVTSNLLGFADVEPVIIPVIPVEVHVAEKVHAYTRLYGRGQRSSTRAKDLVDRSRPLQWAQ